MRARCVLSGRTSLQAQSGRHVAERKTDAAAAACAAVS